MHIKLGMEDARLLATTEGKDVVVSGAAFVSLTGRSSFGSMGKVSVGFTGMASVGSIRHHQYAVLCWCVISILRWELTIGMELHPSKIGQFFGVTDNNFFLVLGGVVRYQGNLVDPSQHLLGLRQVSLFSCSWFCFWQHGVTISVVVVIIGGFFFAS